MAAYEVPQATVEEAVAVLLDLATDLNVEAEVRYSAATTLLHHTPYSPAPDGDIELDDDVIDKLAEDIAKRIKA